MKESNLFVELLQVALGTRDVLSRVPTMHEWEKMLEEAERQAVVGIMVSGMEKLPDNQRPPQMLLLQWIGICQQIEVQNMVTTKACQQLCEQLEKDGLVACVLKGQSNYRYYPSEMANRRSCGDIDVWIDGDVKKTLEYVDKHWERTGLCWLHCNFNERNGVLVEVHFHLSFMSEPSKNTRFQKHFSSAEACGTWYELDGKKIPVLKTEEDVVYQMNHLYRHLIDEGVGLRQVVDYYYLLRHYSEHELPSIDQKLFINKTIERLGMKRFDGALMYVLRALLGMPEEYLLCTASEKDGKFLMNEILLSGNFGHGDPRMAAISSRGYLSGRVSQAWRRFKRNMRFLTSYPGEVIWEPIVRVEHFVWKKLKLWRY